MDTFLPEARKGLDPDFVDDRLSAGDSPPITGGYAGHDRKGLYYVKFLLVVVDLYDPLPDNVLTSVAERTLVCLYTAPITYLPSGDPLGVPEGLRWLQ